MEHLFPRINRRQSSRDRWLGGISGGALLVYGLKRRSFFGGLISLAGADLLAHGATGHHLHELAGITSLTPRGPGASVPHQLGFQVQRSVTVSVAVEDAYQFVSNPENWARFVEGLECVVPKEESISRWTFRGTVSIPGVYAGWIDKMPMGTAFGKGLTLKMGQTHVHRYMRPLLERIQRSELDPSAIITHRLPLDQAPEAYRLFREKRENCLKVVLRP